MLEHRPEPEGIVSLDTREEEGQSLSEAQLVQLVNRQGRQLLGAPGVQGPPGCPGGPRRIVGGEGTCTFLLRQYGSGV